MGKHLLSLASAGEQRPRLAMTKTTQKPPKTGTAQAMSTSRTIRILVASGNALRFNMMSRTE